MRLLIYGGRDYDDEACIRSWLLRLRPDLVISGLAKGADMQGFTVAKELGYPIMAFPANWRGEGKAAGILRNQRMLVEGKPTMGLCFPGGTGTKDMTERLQKADILVRKAWYSIL